MIKISGLVASRAVILLVKPARPSIFSINKPAGIRALQWFLDAVANGNAGTGFDLRFNLRRNTKCAFRAGEGPRTFGFFMFNLCPEYRSTVASAQLALGNFIG